MRRRSILSISAITLLGLAVLAGSAASQQRSLKDQLVGSWTSVAIVTDTGGNKVEPFGPNPRGLLILDSGGRYVVVNLRPNLPKFASNNRMTGTPDENKAIVTGSLAHFGTYTVNEADKTLIFRIEGSTYPSWDGTEQKRVFTLTGDELKYTVPTVTIGAGTSTVVWKRAK